MGGRGSGGHNRKTAEQKKLEGNPGKRQLDKNESKPAPAIPPTCPTWLDKEAKREWRRVIPEMIKAGTITREARSILAAYCSACSEFRQAQEVLNEKGLTQLARHGEAPRPEVKIAREARAQMRALAAELGLTPKSRGYQTGEGAGGKSEPEDPIDKALHTKSRNN